MPSLREQDFDKLAARVVDQFLSGKAKLAEAAAEEAMHAGMNPDQIERLTQAANTMTFLRMMDKRKQEGAGDLMHEFDPIDSRQVIRIVIDSSGVHVDPGPGAETPEGQGPSASDELPDEMAHMRHEMAESPAEEVAEHADDAEEHADDAEEHADEAEEHADDAEEHADKAEKKGPPKKETPKAAALRQMRFRKLASVLEDQFHQAEWSFEDTFQKLAERFKRVYNDVTFEGFEKDALAEHGDEVGLQVLNALRQARGLEFLDEKVAFEKTAALTDRHVSEDSPELHLFEQLVKIAADAHKLRRGLEWMRARCA